MRIIRINGGYKVKSKMNLPLKKKKKSLFRHYLQSSTTSNFSQRDNGEWVLNLSYQSNINITLKNDASLSCSSLLHSREERRKKGKMKVEGREERKKRERKASKEQG